MGERRIFQAEEKAEEDDEELAHQYHTDETLEFLRASLSGFFFLQHFEATSGEEPNGRVELIIQLMKREEIREGTALIIEGESGDKLYIVEEGTLGVTIRGESIRTIGRGALLGELALIYDCPRSATVVCKTDVRVFSLQRKLFKRVMAISVDAVAAQRSRWLLNSPELAILSPMHLSRLVAALKPQSYQKGHLVYEEMQLTSQVTLIERGSASIMTSMDLRGFDTEEVDKMFGILRPRQKARVKSVNTMDFKQLQTFLQSADSAALAADGPSHQIVIEQSVVDQGGASASLLRQGSKLTLHDETGGSSKTWYTACEVWEGCVLGIGVLRGKAGIANGWRWVNDAELQRKGLGGQERAETPFTCQANEYCETVSFTVEAFEALFGAIDNVLVKNNGGGSGDNQTLPYAVPDLQQRTGYPFDVSKFKILSVLGSGSFGTVTLAEYTHPPSAGPGIVFSLNSPGPGEKRMYALKSLSKASIVSSGQLRHVIDEKEILFSMDNPFILKLYGVYQTPHQVVMVTEAIQCGDLWGVIYEEKLVSSSGGVPHDIAQLYAASMIYALDHIHSKLVVFRDLKPENVMMDNKGYPRIIDFGFAKRVPFQKKDTDGIMRIHAKTFTLCGTPEYLPPELIFNMGHDQMVDLWSFGVVMYEMIMGRTPFAPRKQDNITELFTNIAMAKKNGLLLSTRIDDRAGRTPYARDIITQLLKPEPTDRLGDSRNPSGLLKHPYFSGINMDDLYQQRIVPSFIPPINTGKDNATLEPVKAYQGDQSLFETF